MIIYFDTSSLVKLYVEEAHSARVREWVEEAEAVATCRIAYPEAVSAMNRRFRAGDLSKKEYALLTRSLSKDWDDFVVVDFDELEAGRMAEKYGLRGFDAVHLSASRLLRDGYDDIAIAFSSFDRELNDAASNEGFTILTP